MIIMSFSAVQIYDLLHAYSFTRCSNDDLDGVYLDEGERENPTTMVMTWTPQGKRKQIIPKQSRIRTAINELIRHWGGGGAEKITNERVRFPPEWQTEVRQVKSLALFRLGIY